MIPNIFLLLSSLHFNPFNNTFSVFSFTETQFMITHRLQGDLSRSQTEHQLERRREIFFHSFVMCDVKSRIAFLGGEEKKKSSFAKISLSLTHTQQQNLYFFPPQIHKTEIERTASFEKCFLKVFNGKTF